MAKRGEKRRKESNRLKEANSGKQWQTKANLGEEENRREQRHSNFDGICTIKRFKSRNR